ncbi:MAG: ABC transporter ATP-binding protein [Firmicutes bacterium]|nr:ABC transporter ATP-binding protein [Bacillota bacterium]
MAAIVVEGLTKIYGSLRAVDGASFAVERGEVFGLLGPNGAGKTTTVEILVGLRQQDGGKVSVLGFDPCTHAKEFKAKIGVQLQQVALYPRLTVTETVALFASFYPQSLAPVEVIKRVGLAEKAHTQAKDLSGGQRQRLAIALTMVGDGEVVFLAEPTTGLDPQARRGVWELIGDLKARGKTVFLTTHYMEEAERLCDRVAVMDHGRIIALDSPQALIDRHFIERAVEFTSPVLAGDEGLRSLPGVTRLQANDEEGAVTIYTTDVGRTVDALMRHAAAHRAPLENLVVRQASLEDVFLKLTGRRIGE